MRHIRIYLLLILCVGVCGMVLCPGAYAAEKMTDGRRLYDTIMLWVNFGILAALFVKFARKPLMDALRGIHDKIKGEIDGITKQHNEMKSGMDSEQTRLRDIQQHLDEIRTRIIAMGEKEKQRIIDQARLAADKMIKDARAYARVQMIRARKELSDQMVDMAISKVEERLKKEISPEDNENLVLDFLGNLETTKARLN